MKRSKLFTLILVIIFAILSVSTFVACGNKSFTITFDGAGGFLVSGEEIQTVKKSSSINAPIYSKYGYDQNGWDTELSSIKSDMTVKAVWQVTKYKIIYDLAGGIEGESNPREYTIEDDDIVIFEPTRTGYVFIGWTGTGYSSATQKITIPSGSAGNKTFTANWKIEKFKITYDFQGGHFDASLPGDSPKDYTILSTDQHIANPIREGYEFIGWTGDGLTEPTKSVIIPTGSTGDRHYTANWTPMKFNVNFDLNGGTIDGKDAIDPKSVSYDSMIGELPIPEKEGQIFDGWYCGDERVNPTMIYNRTEDMSVTARYADNYTVKFILQSKVGSVLVKCTYDGKWEKADEQIGEGQTLAGLLDAVPSGAYSGDYDFDCWIYVAEDGTEVVVSKDTVFSRDVFKYATVYITAKCKPGPWTPTIPA